ncbi:MAG: AtuA-related protein [Rhodospirillales bacterium]
MAKLHDIAHCRCGDKGDTLIVSLFAYKDADYAFLKERVTAERLAEHLRGIAGGAVRRFELPNVSGLQFVCTRALAGGVTSALTLDAHGKTLSYAVLEMTL